MLAVYISGHGFGHATRVGEVLRALRERAPELPLSIATSAPRELLARAIPGAFELRSLVCDVGLVQKGALVIDEAATAERCRAFAAGWEALVTREAEWLRASGARAVLGDIPPLAFAAAARAGIPSLGLANFSWDWIYRHMAARQPDLASAAQQAASAYGHAALLLELPFAGDLTAFPRREAVGLVARRPRVERDAARRLLGLDSRPAILLSFGGLGFEGLPLEALALQRDLQFLTAEVRVPAGVVSVDGGQLNAKGLGYADVVGAADVVVTKPGYGIVSDAIGAGTRLVYTERGDFPEYPIMVAEMARYLPCVHVGNEDLRAGRLVDPIRKVLALPRPAAPDLGGAARAAVSLLEVLG